MTEIHELNEPAAPTIDSMLDGYTEVITPEVMARLRSDFNARDNQVADLLREAALRHGAMTQLTAEVICQIGIGDPPDEVTRQHIHQQYHAAMTELARILGEQGNN